MNHRLITLWAGLLLPLALHAQPAGTPPQPLSLQQVLQAAQDNLDVALSRRNLAGAQADVTSADRAPLPVLSAGVSQIDLKNGNGSGRVLQDRTYDKSVGLDWTWERGNKRELRTLTAQRSADAARAELDDTMLRQRVAALTAFYELLAAQERLEASAQLDGNAAELARTAVRRLQAGDLSAQETARTEIEAQRARAERRQAELERQRSALVLWQLTALASPPQLQARADWPVATPGMAHVDLDALVEERADVRAARSRVEAAQAALDASAALKKSDVTWGVSYNHYPGTSTALMELRMQMPLQWGYAYQGEIGRASAQLGQAQDALEKTRRQARQEFERLQHEVLSAAERAAVFDGEILPRARRVAEGAELAYRKGALSLTDLLDARRTLRVTALDAVAARKEHAQALGTWQLRTGQTVTAATP
ncbi:MAG: TolC family protein [Hylemonella sp.]|uniref:TolC family protein n=1 Tax=Hylemonella sp. TaxID=2066020 RepID=UPI0022C5BEF2|nr:TolC family protein [Hylemonella sp.]MCZ8252837.1 TolC family protein [Hylemonella sp.]